MKEQTVSRSRHRAISFAAAVIALAIYNPSARATFTIAATDGEAKADAYGAMRAVIFPDDHTIDSSSLNASATYSYTDPTPSTATGLAYVDVDHLGVVSELHGTLNATAASPVSTGGMLTTPIGEGEADLNFYTSSYVHISAVASSSGASGSTHVTGSSTTSGLCFVNDLYATGLISFQAYAKGEKGDTLHAKGTGHVHYSIVSSIPSPVPAGDINSDGSVDPMDITFINFAVNTSSTDSVYDVNADSSVTADDVDDWLSARGTVRGDVNLDGKVDFDDLLVESQNYNKSGTWYEGDFTGDGLVNFDDSLILSQNYGFGVGPN